MGRMGKEQRERRATAAAKAGEASRGSRARTGRALTMMALAVLGAAVAWRRWSYPREQVCPPSTDRFHDHCKEGRRHYVIDIDWTCLGRRRADFMRAALGLPESTHLEGVGSVPSWLTTKVRSGSRSHEIERRVSHAPRVRRTLRRFVPRHASEGCALTSRVATVCRSRDPRRPTRPTLRPTRRSAARRRQTCLGTRRRVGRREMARQQQLARAQ